MLSIFTLQHESTNKQNAESQAYAIYFRPLQTSLAAARFVALVRARESRSYREAHPTRQAYPHAEINQLLEDLPRQYLDSLL
jgi:hypothetical protein